MGMTQVASAWAEGGSARWLVAAATDVGRRRRNNEDAYAVLLKHGIAAVADGMGGHAAGEVASRLAVSHACPLVRTLRAEGESADHAIVEATKRTNEAIWQAAQRAHNNMGTTIVVLCVAEDGVWIGHVGDSRAYVLHGATRALEQLTTDHTLLNQLRQRVAVDDAVVAAYGHVLSRALGTGPDVEVDVRHVVPARGDVLLLCTDGLTGPLDDPTIRSILLRYERDPQACAAALVDAANDRGGPDNVTTVLIRVDDL